MQWVPQQQQQQLIQQQQQSFNHNDENTMQQFPANAFWPPYSTTPPGIDIVPFDQQPHSTSFPHSCPFTFADW